MKEHVQHLSVNAFHIGKATCGKGSCQIPDKKSQTITEMFPIQEAAAGLSPVHPVLYLQCDSPRNKILCGCKAKSNF